jgi:hypothetical protein
MIVIDVQRALFGSRFLADRAHTALRLEHRVVFVERDAVLAFQVPCSVSRLALWPLAILTLVRVQSFRVLLLPLPTRARCFSGSRALRALLIALKQGLHSLRWPSRISVARWKSLGGLYSLQTLQRFTHRAYEVGVTASINSVIPHLFAHMT